MAKLYIIEGMEQLGKTATITKLKNKYIPIIIKIKPYNFTQLTKNIQQAVVNAVKDDKSDKIYIIDRLHISTAVYDLIYKRRDEEDVIKEFQSIDSYIVNNIETKLYVFVKNDINDEYINRFKNLNEIKKLKKEKELFIKFFKLSKIKNKQLINVDKYISVRDIK